MRLTLLLWFITCISTFAQDWQSTYQASVNAFKDENFTEAIARAESAVILSKDLDAKSQAFSLQIFTASSLEGHKTDGVLEACEKEIALFQSLDANGKNHQEAIRKKARLQLLTNHSLDAALTFHQLSLILEQKGKDYLFYRALADEGDAYLQAQKLTEAHSLYEKCLPAFASNPDAGEDFLYTLFNTASIEFQLKNYNDASKKLEQFIKTVEANDLKDIPEYQQSRKMLSTINSQGGASSSSTFLVAEDEVKKLLQNALQTQQSGVDEAIGIYTKAEKVILQNKLVNNSSFSVYVNFARLFYAIGKFDSAFVKISRARTIGTSLYEPKSREMASINVLEGDLLIENGKKADAAARYREAMATIVTQPSDVLAKQSRWMAEQLLKAGLPTETVTLIEKAQQSEHYASIEVNEKILIEKLLLNAAIDLRQIEKSKSRLKQMLLAESNSSLKQGYVLLLAQAEKEDGNYTQSLGFLQQAVNISASGFLDAELQLELGRIHQQLGNYKDAEMAFSKAAEVAPKSHYANVLVPQVYNSFATFYIQMGNYVAAEKLFLKLLGQSKEQSLFYNAVRQNFAAMYQQVGRLPEARRLLIEAVKADKQLFGEEHPDYAIALQNLASVYQRMSKPDSAFILLDQALAIDRKYYGEKSLNYAAKLANLGALHQDQKNFEKALDLYNTALEIRTQKLHAEHPDYNHNLYTIGYLFYRTHQLDKALPYMRESSAFYLRQIRDVFPVLSDYERTAFYNRLQSVINGYQMFMTEYAAKVPDKVGDLLNFRLETKALLLNASLKVRSQILSSNDEQLKSKFAVWQHTKEQLAYLYSLTAAEQQGHRAMMVEYKEKSNELEKWLSLRSEAFANSVNLPVGDWKKIQQTLKADEAAVEIIRTSLPNDSIVYAALIVRAGIPQAKMVVLHDGKALENKIFKLYINSIRFQLEDKISYGHYWKAIDEHLQGINIVYLSGDGVYSKLNPLTFYNTANGQYVLDAYKIQLTSNLKDLGAARQRRSASPAKQNALLLGFPDYRLNTTLHANDIKATDATSNLFFQLIKSSVTDLLGTMHEINEVKTALESSSWNVSPYIRAEATEERIKTTKNPHLIHIATHGFFITSTKSTNVQVHGTDIANIDNNVMLRSGLLLAGAEKNLLERMSGKGNNATEDGVLTAFEIMNMNLDSTRLVVLSACETGIGDMRNGEGVYGLQRAFRLAGADAVIMSLWKVDDEATRYLMTNFYKQWGDAGSRSQAFYNAQKELRKQFAHPYYWGAFLVTGDL